MADKLSDEDIDRMCAILYTAQWARKPWENDIHPEYRNGMRETVREALQQHKHSEGMYRPLGELPEQKNHPISDEEMKVAIEREGKNYRTKTPYKKDDAFD